MRQRIRWRYPASPAAFSTLLAVVLLLGYLALTRVTAQRHANTATNGAEPESNPVIEFDHFTARHERSGNGERLSIALRLRAASPKPLNGFLFVVARNHASPKQWTIWPPEANGLAITAGGHFHGATPTAGQALLLTDRWERISAVLPQQSGQSPFDTVVVYFVSPQGQLLLS